MAENREDLIYSLARSMGMGDAQKTKYSVSNYNSETGTLVCNGHIISRNNIDLAMMYEVAVDAIGFMLQTNVKNPDGIVAKDKDKE